MVNEVIYNLLLFAVGNPENVTGLKVNDVCGITSAIVKLKLINAQIFSLSFGFNELAINGIEFLKACFINLLNGILAKTGNLGNLLVGISTDGKKVSGILIKFLGNPMFWCFE